MGSYLLPTRLSRRQVLWAGILMAATPLLAACGQAAPATPTAEAVKPAAKAAPEGKKVRLIAVDTGDGTFLRNALKPFLERNPNIEVEIVAVAWAQYDEKVDLLVAGGEAPALWWPGAKRGYRYYAIRDMFPDLTPYIQRDKYDTSDFFEPTWKYVHWQGKPVAFPSQHHLAPYIFFNKTLFDQAGVQYPPTTWEDTSWTWDRFLELAKALTKPNPDPTKAVWGTSGAWTDLRHAAWVWGGDYFDEKDYEGGLPKKANVNRPEVIDGLQFMADLIHKYKVQPSPADLQVITAGGVNPFMVGRVAMAPGATWNLLQFATIKDFQWDVAPLPIAPKSPIQRKLLLYPDQWTFFKATPYPDQAWELLKYMVSPEGMTLYSIEGRNTLPSRKSVGERWVSKVLESTKLPRERIEMVLNGIKYSQVTASHAIPKFAEAHDVAIKPPLDELWLGKITAKEAVARMEPKINEILAQP